MSKSTRNNGIYSQDQLLGQFKRDAHSSIKGSAVDQCMNSKKLKPQKEDQPRFSGRFVPTT